MGTYDDNLKADIYDTCVRLNARVCHILKMMDVLNLGLMHEDDHNNTSDISCIYIIKEFMTRVYMDDVVKLVQLAEALQKIER